MEKTLILFLFCSASDVGGASACGWRLGSGRRRDDHAGQRRQGSRTATSCAPLPARRFPRKPKPTGRKPRWRSRQPTRLAGTPSNCDSVSVTFRDANKKQGGKFAEAVLHAGPGCRPLRQAGRSAQAVQRRRSPSIPSSAARAWVSASMPSRRAARLRPSLPSSRPCATTLAAPRLREPGDDADGAQRSQQRRRAQQPASRTRDRRPVTCPRSTRWRCLFLGRAQDNKKMLDLAGVVCRQAQLINANYAPIYNTWGLINVQQGERFRRPPHVREGVVARSRSTSKLT